MIYFDNSATTRFKPDCVLSALVSAVKDYSANPGRSGHGYSTACAQKVYEARKSLCDFLGADEVIFTDNCTGALNLAIAGSVQNGDHIVVSQFEHNAVLRTVHALYKKGVISYSVARPIDGIIYARSVYSAIKPNTKAVVISQVSNVLGVEAKIDEIALLCKQKGITLIIDGAQSVGHIPVNIKKMGKAMIAVAPHKGLNSIQGVGILALTNTVKLSPYRYGGTGSSSLDLNQPCDIPEGFETGTLPVPAILPLPYAIRYNQENFALHSQKLLHLSSLLHEELERVREVTLYSPKVSHCGIITFSVSSLDSEIVSSLLYQKAQICVRGGYHCAPLTHSYLGTEKSGAVRVSLGVDSTESEVEIFIQTLRSVIANR